MEWARQIRDDLSLAWTAQLSSDLRDRLVISYDKMDELRFSLSHHRVGKQLRPRIWFNNPWNGDKLTFPQPIRPRSGVLGWARLIAAAQVRFGLTMDAKGRVAQRSYSKTVALQYERDKARKLLRPITKGEPLVNVIGADGTGVGKRSIMHVASSIAPSYRDGISVENEKNINTVATSITDDHWAGLNEVLCSNFYIGTGDILPPNSIAADINGMLRTGLLPGTDVPVKVTGCFDLVAARGIRGCRGRGACHTESQTADRFNVPNITPQTTWAEAKKMLHEVPMLKNSEMRDDSHTPPADWDYSASAWKCRRKGCTVMFETHMQFCNARKQFLSAKADKSADGKKATSARAKTYAELHSSQQEEFCPPCTRDLDMEDIIIDPLHCLLLNLPKIAWKYTFGDRMTNEQRELVAEYLTLIGCPLDVRNKQDGRDANRKWFTGESFQRFVEGDASSPGLAENIRSIMDIIYLKAPAPPDPVASTEPAVPVPKGNSTAKRGGGGERNERGVSAPRSRLQLPQPPQLTPLSPLLQQLLTPPPLTVSITVYLQFPPLTTPNRKGSCVPGTVVIWTWSSSVWMLGSRSACCTPSGEHRGRLAPSSTRRCAPSRS